MAVSQKKAKVAPDIRSSALLTIATVNRIALGTLALGIMYPDNKRLIVVVFTLSHALTRVARAQADLDRKCRHYSRSCGRRCKFH